MVRVKQKAKANLRQYAAQLSGERGRTVPMTKALEEVLLNLLPLKKRTAA
mgnify:CR=1 FL=1